MTYTAPTAETIKDWLSATQADDLLTEAFQDQNAARVSLITRLQGGLVRAVALKTQWSNRRDQVPLFEITSSAWEDLTTTRVFWKSSDWIYEARASSGYGFVTVSHYGVRFDPAGIQEIIDNLRPAPLLADAPQEEPEPEPEQKGPRVTDPDLNAWFEVYKRAYGGGPKDTLDNAWKSARGMFFDKSVTRERIRKLLAGGRKPGPKPGAND